MSESFLNSRVHLHCGDCRDVLAQLDENSIDACCTDPPYHLTSIVKRFGAEDAAPAQFGSDGRYTRASAGFMGQRWDGGDIAFDPDTWRAVYRVLKPGAHICVFAIPKHIGFVQVAMQQAGFEFRDVICWLFGSGFPKNHSVNRSPMFCQCGEVARNVARIVPLHKRDGHSGTADNACDDGLPLSNALRSSDTEQDWTDDYPQDHDLSDGQLRLDASGDQVSSPSRQYVQGHNHSFACEDGSQPGSSHSPSPARCSDHLSNQDCEDRGISENAKSVNISKNRSPADISESDDCRQDNSQGLSSDKYASGFPRCQICGKPIVDGYGTSLKPACEMIVLARKPLSESTVAANVLRWGTGAINIDGCRVATDWDSDLTKRGWQGGGTQFRYDQKFRPIDREKTEANSLGRWPANLVHDGSAEVTAAFPDTSTASDRPRNNGAFDSVAKGHDYPHTTFGYADDGGSAARFFYTSKADSDDRLGSKHPTVKPLDLIQYLVRLITPPRGVCLDPFAGTGTTGEAAWREGMSVVLIEREEEYCADIRRRMALTLAGPDERMRESIKARNLPRDDGPLFEWQAAP